MEVSGLVNKRRALYFTDDEVTEDDFDYVLKAARWAPSACNVARVVRKPENIQKIWESTRKHILLAHTTRIPKKSPASRKSLKELVHYETFSN